MASQVDTNVLPREIAPGLYWLGKCEVRTDPQGRILHSYRSMYLVTGDEFSALVDCGQYGPVGLPEEQVEQVLALGVPPLRYLFLTHTETPHAGGVGRLMARYPDLVVSGCIEDLHLVFPELGAERFRPLDPGDGLDLGGTQLMAVEAVIRDMPRTRWGFDTRRKMLFTGDGFAYGHYHEAHQCGHLAEEVPELDLPVMTAFFNDAALYWMRFNDIEPYVERLDRLVFEELDAQFIGGAHGLPISDPAATMPAIRAGLRQGTN